MTWFDLLVISLMGLSILFAAHRGMAREVVTLIALAIGGVAALWLTGPVSTLFGAGSLMITMLIALALFGLFFLASVISKNLLVGHLLGKKPGIIDRIMGGVFGFLRGWLLVGLGFLALEYYFEPDRRPQGFDNAMTYGFAEMAARALEDFGLQTLPPPEAETGAQSAHIKSEMDKRESGDKSAAAQGVTKAVAEMSVEL